MIPLDHSMKAKIPKIWNFVDQAETKIVVILDALHKDKQTDTIHKNVIERLIKYLMCLLQTQGSWNTNDQCRINEIPLSAPMSEQSVRNNFHNAYKQLEKELMNLNSQDVAMENDKNHLHDGNYELPENVQKKLNCVKDMRKLWYRCCPAGPEYLRSIQVLESDIYSKKPAVIEENEKQKAEIEETNRQWKEEKEGKENIQIITWLQKNHKEKGEELPSSFASVTDLNNWLYEKNYIREEILQQIEEETESRIQQRREENE